MLFWKEIFKLWNGGMSFHGGFIGVIIAVIYTSKVSKIPIMVLADLIAIVSPIGIFFGRLANFINGTILSILSFILQLIFALEKLSEAEAKIATSFTPHEIAFSKPIKLGVNAE